MKSFVYSVIIVTFIQLLHFSCANQTSIQGGPRDTIPPVLIEAIPPDGTVNFSEQSIQLLFSEPINADQLKSQLIVIPNTELDYKVLVKKELLVMEFEEPFQDSTTYILNFAEGVGDQNENNAVLNLKYAFSTHYFIDSLKVSGQVVNITTNKPLENHLVSLYGHDTTNVFEHNPIYFVFTDEQGQFEITNIKQGQYRIYAYNDKNKNLRLNSDEEAHGFHPDTLNLDSSLSDLRIPVFLQDANELTFNRSRPRGNHYDLSFSKFIDNYNYTYLDTTFAAEVPNNLVDDNTTIRFYQIQPISADSLGIDLTVFDSLGNQLRDTLYLRFDFSETRPDAFELLLKPSNRIRVFDSTMFKVEANKPISIINNALAHVKVDTLILPIYPDTIFSYETNSKSTAIQFKLKSIFEDVNLWIDSLVASTTQDTSLVELDSTILQQYEYHSQLKKDNYTIEFTRGWMVSIEGDSSEAQSVEFTKMDPESLGVVRGTIEPQQSNIILLLVDKNGKVIQSISNPGSAYEFTRIAPGEYSLKVLYDTNQDGQWSHGNIRKHIGPEPVWYYPESFEVRANWELENINLAPDSVDNL